MKINIQELMETAFKEAAREIAKDTLLKAMEPEKEPKLLTQANNDLTLVDLGEVGRRRNMKRASVHWHVKSKGITTITQGRTMYITEKDVAKIPYKKQGIK